MIRFVSLHYLLPLFIAAASVVHIVALHHKGSNASDEQVFGSSRPQSVPSEPEKGDPSAELKLVSFPRAKGCVTTLTPFGAKFEVALRLAGIEYSGTLGDVLNPRHAPKGKVRRVFHSLAQKLARRCSQRACNLP